jgi:hypothetical protein
MLYFVLDWTDVRSQKFAVKKFKAIPEISQVEKCPKGVGFVYSVYGGMASNWKRLYYINKILFY